MPPRDLESMTRRCTWSAVIDVNPTTLLRCALPLLLSAALVLVASPIGGQVQADSQCSSELKKRSPEQVLTDHRAALAAGDYDAAVCNYAEDATVISDGGVDVGRAQIRSSLVFFNEIFGGTQPEVIQQIVVEAIGPNTHMVRLLFTVDTACIAVPDGIDTYVINKGQIHSQTSHGFPIFDCF